MKRTTYSSPELLKTILVNLRTPEKLNEHPWAAFITDSIPYSAPLSKGERLADLVTYVFRKMLPDKPPRAGKRLDTRWGVFGILAAQYFIPAILGEPAPSNLREAWGKIDRSILYFVYGRTDMLTESERASHLFAGSELEPAPTSTLSDWQRRGIQQLAEITEMELKRLTDKLPPPPVTPQPRSDRRWIGAVSAVILLLLFGWLSFHAWTLWGVYQHAQSIQQKVGMLETSIQTTPSIKDIPEMAARIHALRVELDTLQSDVAPYLWLAPYGSWIPQRGGDINQTGELLSLAQSLVTAADEGLTAITPAVNIALQDDQPLEIMDLLLSLQAANPRLQSAQIALAQAQTARGQINVDNLSPSIKKMITERVDPLFESITNIFPINDMLSLVRAAPKLLGAGKSGPQTYLLMMQNEDELRPTGGFLTAIGSVVIKDGKVISIDIESSDKVDDMSKLYPTPPWQFETYMNIPLFLLRDANWYTDFPTTVSWVEYFYSYTRASSANGVIAIDMQVTQQLLENLGPVRVKGVDQEITSQNVMDYLRSAEKAPPPGVEKDKWDRKQFIGELAEPLLEKILNARGETWTKLAPVIIQMLDERHILLQFDDEDTTAFLARRNWDGAVRLPGQSDFVMVIDTNMGYNKSNALMAMNWNYRVDLREPSHPKSLLRVQQTNRSKIDIPCEINATYIYLPPEQTSNAVISDPFYNMDECHWGYLRVYLPEGSHLTRSNPHEIPAKATMLDESIPARTDDLGNEDIQGAQVYGMMVITPTRSSTNTEFEYDLPATVLSKDGDTWIYRLTVQKQAGILAQPFLLQLQLPQGAKIQNSSVPLNEKDGLWITELDLRKDLVIEVRFTSAP